MDRFWDRGRPENDVKIERSVDPLNQPSAGAFSNAKRALARS
jgi:hypothetical protein